MNDAGSDCGGNGWGSSVPCGVEGTVEVELKVEMTAMSLLNVKVEMTAMSLVTVKVGMEVEVKEELDAVVVVTVLLSSENIFEW